MGPTGKPWDICVDCLDPLSKELVALSRRFNAHFDVPNLCQDSSSKPPCIREIDSLYKRVDTELAIEFLRLNVSVEYGDSTEHRLLAPRSRFAALEHKARLALNEPDKFFEIIRGEWTQESTAGLSFPTVRLIDRHRDLLEEEFREYCYDQNRDELPEEVLLVEVEIVDEYDSVRHDFLELAEYLRRVSALIRSKRPVDEADEFPPQALGLQLNVNPDQEAEGMPARSDVAHSTDFRSGRWFGKQFTFTTTQAACVQVLWRNWEQGTPVISEVTVLDGAGSAGDRLRDVFSKGIHPAWGTLIKPARKGAFQLVEPDES
jgi:hypothetical protein